MEVKYSDECLTIIHDITNAMNRPDYLGELHLAQDFVNRMLDKFEAQINPIARNPAPDKLWLRKYGTDLRVAKWRNGKVMWYAFYFFISNEKAIVSYITNSEKDGRRLGRAKTKFKKP